MKNNKKYKYPFLNPSLPLNERVTDLISRLKTDEKIRLLSTKQTAVPRLGVKEWHIGTEVARGYIGRDKEQVSTVFPQPIGLASTFDAELMEKLGEIAGNEARIYNKKFTHTKLMLWGPTVDMCRHPLWGRNEEGYGEDPVLAGEMTSAYCKGMRGNDKFYLKTVPTLKHFCANNHEEDRGTDNSNLEPRTKYEYYYAAFETAVKDKNAFSLMTAYNEISGVPALNNPDLKKICKDKWGLGFTVTDGGDFVQNVHSHKYSDSHAETLALALKAGNDVMTDISETVFAAGKEALRQGLLTEEELNTAVGNVLKYRFRLGEFDPPEINPYADIPDNLLDCKEYRQTNLRAAEECITLLKNENLLPLSKDKIKKLAVVGPLADGEFHDWYTGYSSYNISVLKGLEEYLGAEKVTYDDGYDCIAVKSELNGKYLETDKNNEVYARADKPVNKAVFKKLDWDGEILLEVLETGKMLRDDGSYLADSESVFEWFVRETLRPRIYNGSTCYKSWNKRDVRVDEKNNFKLISDERKPVDKSRLFNEELVSDGCMRAAELAKSADAVVVCVGNDPMMGARECYDRKSLKLNQHQQKLINAVKAVNKNVILLIISSYPYTVCEEQETIPAIIYTAHGGPEAGRAVSSVLFGEYNPAGRVCQTWYKNELDLPSIKDYDIIGGNSTYLYFNGEPLYPFGHGLSYSEFEYGNFDVCEDKNGFNAHLTIKNISGYDGDEVVQIYFGMKFPRVRRPEKALCAFKRCHVKAGETANIEFKINKDKLRFYDVTRDRFAVEQGEYIFYAAASSRDIRCQKALSVSGEKIPPRDLKKLTPAINYDAKSQVKMCWAKKLEKHYLLANGWNSEIIFENVIPDNIKTVEITASVNMNAGKAEIYAEDYENAESGKTPAAIIELPASAYPFEFKKYKADFNFNGKKPIRLRVKLSTDLNILNIKLI